MHLALSGICLLNKPKAHLEQSQGRWGRGAGGPRSLGFLRGNPGGECPRFLLANCSWEGRQNPVMPAGSASKTTGPSPAAPPESSPRLPLPGGVNRGVEGIPGWVWGVPFISSLMARTCRFSLLLVFKTSCFEPYTTYGIFGWSTGNWAPSFL